MDMFYNEFIYICIWKFFSTNSFAFSLRTSCTYMARNYNYHTAVFFTTVNKVAIIIKAISVR